MELLPLFEWFDQSALAGISKSYGGVFAMVQAVHLSSLALLGGMVIAMDLRLLNLLMVSVPAETVVNETRRWIGWALVMITISGIYQAAAVAIKLYYNTFFWAKMSGLLLGLIILYGIKLPLFDRYGLDSMRPLTVKIIATASLVTWFSVAATGRWIGFS